MAAGQYGTPCAEFGHNHRPIHISVEIFSPQQSSPLAARTLAWTWIARALAQPRIARTRRGRGLLVLAVLAEQAGLGIAGGGALLRALLALAIPRRLDLFRRRGEPHREDDEGANHANEDREDQGQETCI